MDSQDSRNTPDTIDVEALLADVVAGYHARKAEERAAATRERSARSATAGAAAAAVAAVTMHPLAPSSARRDTQFSRLSDVRRKTHTVDVEEHLADAVAMYRARNAEERAAATRERSARSAAAGAAVAAAAAAIMQTSVTRACATETSPRVTQTIVAASSHPSPSGTVSPATRVSSMQSYAVVRSEMLASATPPLVPGLRMSAQPRIQTAAADTVSAPAAASAAATSSRARPEVPSVSSSQARRPSSPPASAATSTINPVDSERELAVRLVQPYRHVVLYVLVGDAMLPAGLEAHLSSVVKEPVCLLEAARLSREEKSFFNPSKVLVISNAISEVRVEWNNINGIARRKCEHVVGRTTPMVHILLFGKSEKTKNEPCPIAPPELGISVSAILSAGVWVTAARDNERAAQHVSNLISHNPFVRIDVHNTSRSLPDYSSYKTYITIEPTFEIQRSKYDASGYVKRMLRRALEEHKVDRARKSRLDFWPLEQKESLPEWELKVSLLCTSTSRPGSFVVKTKDTLKQEQLNAPPSKPGVTVVVKQRHLEERHYSWDLPIVKMGDESWHSLREMLVVARYAIELSMRHEWAVFLS